MIWKQVHYVKTNRWPEMLPNIPLEQVFTEDIFVDELGVIVVGDWGYNRFYQSEEDYKQKHLAHVVLDLETDVIIVDITEC